MENTANTPYGVINPASQGSFLFTAEHASSTIPISIQDSDIPFMSTHWAVDIGILPLLKLLCAQHNSQGVYTKYSRLWIDANRAPDQDGLIKTHIGETPLSFNQSLTPKDTKKRLLDIHEAYHQTISSCIDDHLKAPLLVSLHSFTPIWNDHIRTMDTGVLFDRDEELAHICTKLLRQEGFFVEENQPYSGKNGLIYSAHRHGTEKQIPYIELEFNQSILCTPQRIERVAHKVSRVLSKLQNEYSHFLIAQN